MLRRTLQTVNQTKGIRYVLLSNRAGCIGIASVRALLIVSESRANRKFMSSVVHKTITPTRLSASRDELSGLQSTMPSGRRFAYHEWVSIAVGVHTAGVLSKL